MKLFATTVFAIVLAAPIGNAMDNRIITEPNHLIEKTLLPALRSRIIQNSKTLCLPSRPTGSPKTQLATPCKAAAKPSA